MEYFIEKVKFHPCVWDMNHMSYRDSAKKEISWERIAKDCGIESGNEAKLQWKKIRDSHREALRRRKTLNIKPWRYEAIMEFLLPQIENRTTTTNSSKVSQGSSNETPSVIDAINTDEGTSSLLESTHRKKPRNIGPGKSKPSFKIIKKREQRQYQRDDHGRRELEVDRFSRDALTSLFDSFCQKTRDLPRYLQLRVQREVFESITRAEEEAMMYVTFEPNNSISRSPSSASYEYTSVKTDSFSPNASPVPKTPTYSRSEPEVTHTPSIHIKEDVLTDSD